MYDISNGREAAGELFCFTQNDSIAVSYRVTGLVRTPPPPVRRHHQIAASGRDP